MSENVKRLHLGCGRNILQGWINLDCIKHDGVDVIADLDNCAVTPLPFEDDSIDEFIGNDLLEHIKNNFALMQELHRIAKPGAKCVFSVPYGSSDDAYEDPTHVRIFFLGSFGCFSQPYYWRSDYGYRGDWLTRDITLYVKEEKAIGKTAEQILHEIDTYRNIVIKMIAQMFAVKPIRKTLRELQVPPNVNIIPIDEQIINDHQYLLQSNQKLQ